MICLIWGVLCGIYPTHTVKVVLTWSVIVPLTVRRTLVSLMYSATIFTVLLTFRDLALLLSCRRNIDDDVDDYGSYDMSGWCRQRSMHARGETAI